MGELKETNININFKDNNNNSDEQQQDNIINNKLLSNKRSLNQPQQHDEDNNDDCPSLSHKTKRVRFDTNVIINIVEHHSNKSVDNATMSLSPPELKRTVASCWLYFPYSNIMPPSSSYYYSNLPSKNNNKTGIVIKEMIDVVVENNKNQDEKTSSGSPSSSVGTCSNNLLHDVFRLNWLKVTKELPPTSGSFRYDVYE